MIKIPNKEEVEKVVQSQREKEKHGRFVRVDSSTLVFVKEGQNANAVITNYLNKKQMRGAKCYVSMGF